MKKILTIQDLSCLGQCSLTVALPIISSCGVEAVVMPTALLSNHTCGFKGFTCLDLTDELNNIVKHWDIEGFNFDGIYTGYLGSNSLIDIACNVIDKYKKEDDVILVDPAMADSGKLYPAFNMDYVNHMRNLISKATHIIPNITEAVYLLGMEYKDTYTIDEIKDIMIKLSLMGPRYVIMTGVSTTPCQIGAMYYDSVNNIFKTFENEYVNTKFHGTGDVFASAFYGSLINGKSMDDALKLAVDFTLQSIKYTVDDKEHWYGVHFEKALNMLSEK